MQGNPVHRVVPALLIIGGLGLAGCSRDGFNATGTLSMTSLQDTPVVFEVSYPDAVYGIEPGGQVSFLLTNIPIDELIAGTFTNGVLVHIELLWEPKPGATPMDSSATNAAIRSIVVSNGEIGIYEGGGFVLPGAAVGADRIPLSVRDATVRLDRATDGFVDLLTPAQITGSVRARLDPAEARRLRYAASQFATNAFGETVFVQGNVETSKRRNVEIKTVVAGGLDQPRWSD